MRNIGENVKGTYPSLKPASKLFVVLLIRISRIVPSQLLKMFTAKI
jgi:hypothetical protein